MSLLYKRLPIALTIAISFALILASCGSSRQEDEPRATVADPRAYAVEALQTMDLNTWWQAYRNPDPELLGKIVDEVAEKQPDGLPTDARKLDTLIRHQIASRYKSYMDDTDEGKAFILDQAMTRFADPPMATWGNDGNYAVLDYHVLPGEWKMVSRTSDGLKDPPAVDHPFLKPDVLADSLQRLVTAYPDSRVYEIYYQYHFGSDLKKIHLSFVPDGSTTYIEGMNIQLRRRAGLLGWICSTGASISLTLTLTGRWRATAAAGAVGHRECLTTSCRSPLTRRPTRLPSPILGSVPDQIVDRILDVVVGVFVVWVIADQLPFDQFDGACGVRVGT